jgi:ssRNA-specific RNase YbeY (16S rRNA maturation enzyme)
MKNTKKSGTYLRRPTKISILNQDFRIEWVSSGDALGSVDLCKCVIQIVKDYPKHSIADTFLHEVIHAIHHVMGVTDSTTEEDSTSRLATGLCTVWRHNSKAFEWLNKQLKDG